MKFHFSLLMIISSCHLFSQGIDFRGHTMILKDPLPENVVIEVSDTLMRLVTVIRHDNGAKKVQGFMFGFNDEGLFQSHKVPGEKVPANLLKKALDQKASKIYFNKLEIRQGYMTVVTSFVLKIIYH